MQRCRFLNWRVVTGKLRYYKVKWKSVNSAGGTRNMSRIYREGQPSFHETWLTYNRVKNRLKTIHCLEEQCLYFVHCLQYFHWKWLFFYRSYEVFRLQLVFLTEMPGLLNCSLRLASEWSSRQSCACPFQFLNLRLNVLEFYLLTNNSQKVWKGNYRLLGAISVKTTCSWFVKRSSSLFWEKKWKYIFIN